ncbi:ribonuclease 3-like protein 2 [Vicia villosa]|uniref:ribonuclease 3-like protein 2 n=1 Tax=Vicia villosa TaxID=3911 RepID=UPI00273C27FD|nr:ribonuclease 3-like protein 2 [Vicia villosa]
MEASVFAVEKIIGYTFQNKKLLEHALTHTSYPEADSYEHLEYVGDAVLGLAISSHLFLTYSSVDSDTLSLLRAANVSTEKLARAAVRHGLHSYVRHNMVSIGDEIKEFVDAIDCKNDCSGSVKAPKILADIMKSIVAAIFIDVNLDLKRLWVIIKGLLEPMVTLDDLEQNPQPVKMLYEICQKNGKKVDGELVASSSEQKDIARFEAAKAALDKLP